MLTFDTSCTGDPEVRNLWQISSKSLDRAKKDAVAATVRENVVPEPTDGALHGERTPIGAA
jgi:hypothetical protein